MVKAGAVVWSYSMSLTVTEMSPNSLYSTGPNALLETISVVPKASSTVTSQKPESPTTPFGTITVLPLLQEPSAGACTRFQV